MPFVPSLTAVTDAGCDEIFPRIDSYCHAEEREDECGNGIDIQDVNEQAETFASVGVRLARFAEGKDESISPSNNEDFQMHSQDFLSFSSYTHMRTLSLGDDVAPKADCHHLDSVELRDSCWKTGSDEPVLDTSARLENLIIKNQKTLEIIMSRLDRTQSVTSRHNSSSKGETKSRNAPPKEARGLGKTANLKNNPLDRISRESESGMAKLSQQSIEEPGCGMKPIMTFQDYVLSGAPLLLGKQQKPQQRTVSIINSDPESINRGCSSTSSWDARVSKRATKKLTDKPNGSLISNIRTKSPNGPNMEYSRTRGELLKKILGITSLCITIGKISADAFDINLRVEGGDRRVSDQIQYALSSIMIFETLARIGVEGRDFVSVSNIIDLVVICICVFELITNMSSAVLKPLVLMRALRILEALRAVREFRKMIFALMSSIPTLAYASMVVTFVMFSFGEFFTTQVIDRHLEEISPSHTIVRKHFASLQRATYSMGSSILGGISWCDLCDHLWEIDGYLALVFVLYILFMVLGVLNIVTSIFVDCALWSTNKFKSLLCAEKKHERDMFVRHLKEMFKSCDEDGSGEVSPVELEAMMRDEDSEICTYLKALDIDVNSATTLFALLDVDGSGCLGVEEFVNGCMELKGEAKNIDMKCVTYNIVRIAEQLDWIMDAVNCSEYGDASMPPRTSLMCGMASSQRNRRGSSLK